MFSYFSLFDVAFYLILASLRVDVVSSTTDLPTFTNADAPQQNSIIERDIQTVDGKSNAQMQGMQASDVFLELCVAEWLAFHCALLLAADWLAGLLVGRVTARGAASSKLCRQFGMLLPSNGGQEKGEDCELAAHDGLERIPVAAFCFMQTWSSGLLRG